jgi:hypothetical protein
MYFIIHDLDGWVPRCEYLNLKSGTQLAHRQLEWPDFTCRRDSVRLMGRKSWAATYRGPVYRPAPSSL